MINRTYWALTREKEFLYQTDEGRILWGTEFDPSCLFEWTIARNLQMIYTGSQLLKFQLTQEKLYS